MTESIHQKVDKNPEVVEKAKHHFHSISKDLKTLVLFSKGPVAADEKEN